MYTVIIVAACSSTVMYEVELISFVDHDAADAYASFTKASATSCHLNRGECIVYPVTTGGEGDGIGESADGGG